MKKYLKKRAGYGVEFRTISSADGGTNYLVFRTAKGSFHVFAEVNAKQAATDCGATGSPKDLTTRQMWEQLWK